ncbi:hypothetical protein GCM10027168_03910 [Streptomyces capparidis]
MTITDGVGLRLTPDQQRVVAQPWDARMLVTAGAGAGKTTTLAYRIEHLTGVEELEAAEILVLSFSRAAVRELRGRVDRLAGAARRVRAQTFDSWASCLLRRQYPDRADVPGRTFDERIVRATEAIEAGVIETLEQGIPAHVIIDEGQDLVGGRRELVEAVLDRFADNCGFTVVGDAAQSIYGFQVSEPGERTREANRFLEWVRLSFGDDLIEVSLTDNFRARTPEARVALPYGVRLQELPSDQAKADVAAAAIHTELRAHLLETPRFGELSEPFVSDSLRHYEGTTAILCRDNGQVLAMSERLHSHEVPHHIQRSLRTRPVPAWIGGLLRATGAAAMTEDRFAEVVSELPMSVDAEPARAWRALRRVAPGARNQLDLEALRRVVAEAGVPDELTVPPAHRVVVSTVHRAKGLEFDRVLIVEPEALSARRGRAEDPPAEARLLYVAMTRARDDIYRLTRPETWMLRKADRRLLSTGRWYVGGRERWVRKGLEASEWDVCHEAPPGAGESVADPIEVEKLLLGSVRSGDEVELRRLHDLPGSDETPPYGIFHDGRPIGVVSKRFRSDLYLLLQQSRAYRVEQWPYRILGLRVDTLEAVVGDPTLTERHGMGDRGVWFAPRLCGLGRFDWSHAKSVPEGHPHS